MLASSWPLSGAAPHLPHLPQLLRAVLCGLLVVTMYDLLRLSTLHLNVVVVVCGCM